MNQQQHKQKTTIVCEAAVDYQHRKQRDKFFVFFTKFGLGPFAAPAADQLAAGKAHGAHYDRVDFDTKLIQVWNAGDFKTRFDILWEIVKAAVQAKTKRLTANCRSAQAGHRFFHFLLFNVFLSLCPDAAAGVCFLFVRMSV